MSTIRSCPLQVIVTNVVEKNQNIRRVLSFHNYEIEPHMFLTEENHLNGISREKLKRGILFLMRTKNLEQPLRLSTDVRETLRPVSGPRHHHPGVGGSVSHRQLQRGAADVASSGGLSESGEASHDGGVEKAPPPASRLGCSLSVRAPIAVGQCIRVTLQCWSAPSSRSLPFSTRSLTRPLAPRTALFHRAEPEQERLHFDDIADELLQVRPVLTGGLAQVVNSALQVERSADARSTNPSLLFFQPAEPLAFVPDRSTLSVLALGNVFLADDAHLAILAAAAGLS